MSRLEIRASLSLALLFAVRMLGLFLILPVFAAHAPQLAHGDDQVLVGLALGAYGFTQGIFQIPFGAGSDRYGRKRVIVLGLLLFAAGSFIAAFADDIYGVILGRAVQGAGAISAAVTALAADLTREEHRTKAMAMIGGSIGLTFALSLVAGPALYGSLGLSGIFEITGALALAAIWITTCIVPLEPRGGNDRARRVRRGALSEVLRNVDQLRLNFGIFSLHVVQIAIFVVVPVALVRYGGIAVSEHWKVYLPVVIGSFVLMVPLLLHAERRGRTRFLFLSAIVMLLSVELGLAVCLDNFYMVVVLLLAFFVAFNVLEASLPSLVSRLVPMSTRGTALGVYNTTQSLGLFVGGAAGGWLAKHFGETSVFVFGIAVAALWLLVALGMRMPGEAAERTFSIRAGVDPVALREGLLRLRGVRDVAVTADKGVVRLRVYPESFDAERASKLIEGETNGIGQ
jgi:MFS family permease